MRKYEVGQKLGAGGVERTHAPPHRDAPRRATPHAAWELRAKCETATHSLPQCARAAGKGAYAVVFKAVDRKGKGTVALKKIFDAFLVTSSA